ncbi:MAG: hypothetical protein WKF88_07430 [Ferruginibacter sp.]
MIKAGHKFSVLSGLRKFRIRRVLYIALFWTVIDFISTILNFNTHESQSKSVLVRAILVFLMSGIMGYLFVFTLKNIFRESSLGVNFIAKSLILLVAALVMNFLVHFVESVLITGLDLSGTLKDFMANIMDGNWLLRRTMYWLVLFIVTQL